MSESVYTVRGMTCAHCVDAVTTELSSLATVTQVDVELASGRVRMVSGEPLDDDAVRTAVREAGSGCVVTVLSRGLRPRTPSPPGSLAVARSAGQELRS